MATQYTLNFSDPSKTTTVVINGPTKNNYSTSLDLVGPGYVAYGETIAQDFLKLLENFSNSTPPANPILGQLWYNTFSNSLNVCYAEASGTVETKFKPLATSNSGDTAPSDPSTGDLWYDSTDGQLKLWNGSEYITIGPEIGANIKAKWRGDFEYNALIPDLPVFNIKAVLGTDDEVVAIVSAETYDMSDAYTTPPAYASRTSTFTKIVKGITLQGADPITGSSRSAVTGLTTSSYFLGDSG
jgi:hypothetical protein